MPNRILFRRWQLPNIQIPVGDINSTIQIMGDIHDDTITQSRKVAVENDKPIIPVCIAVLGDLTDYAEGIEDTSVLNFLNSLGSTWYAACGNHDVSGNARTPAQWATAYGMDGRDFYKDIGSPAFARLIFLGVNSDSSPHTLDATALSNLNTWLGSTSLSCVIFTHFPPYNTVTNPDYTNYFTSLQNHWYLKDQAAIWSILKIHNNAIAWVSGHIHADMSSSGLVKSEQIGSHLVHFIAASSIYYTKRVLGETASDIITAYLSISSTSLTVYYRNVSQRKFVKRFYCPIHNDLSSITPELLDTFSNNNEVDLSDGFSSHICDTVGELEILDSNNVISISGGKLVINGSPVNSDGFVGHRPILRIPGRAMRLDMPDRTTVPSTNLCWGLGSTRLGSKILEIGTGIDNLGTISVRSTAGTVLTTDFTSTAFRFTTGTVQTLLIMRSKGGLILARDDSLANNTWRIIYIYSSYTNDLYAKLLLSSASSNMAFDNLSVSDLGGIWVTDYGGATVYRETTTSGQIENSSDGNFIMEFTWTAVTGTSIDIMCRRTDDTHTWIVRCDQSNSTIKLISVNGTETERATAAMTWINGTEYTIQIIMSTIGSSHGQRVMVNDTAKLAATTNYNPTVTGIKVPVGKNLAIWARDQVIILN